MTYCQLNFVVFILHQVGAGVNLFKLQSNKAGKVSTCLLNGIDPDLHGAMLDKLISSAF